MDTKRLHEDKILKLLVDFSIPAIVGVVINSFYTIIDRIFVGQFVGKDAFSGIGSTFAISMVMMAFGMLIGIGAASRFSIALGKKDKATAGKIMGNAFTMTILISLTLTLLGLIFLDPLLGVLGADAHTKPYAKQFIGIILCGAVFQAVGFGLNGLISASGHPHKSMITLILNACINIILLFVFIPGLKWGVAGSALATLIAQAVSAIWVILCLRDKKNVAPLKLSHMKLDRDIIFSIFTIGLSPFLMQLAGSFAMGLFSNSLSRYGGQTALGAMNAVYGLTMFLIMPIIGLNQGAQPIFGYNYGARQYRRVEETLKLAITGATLYAAFIFIMIELFPSTFISIFTGDHEIVQAGTNGIRIYLMMLPVVGFQIVSANFFQAIGKSGKSILMNLLRQVIVLIPMLLILPGIFGVKGIWMSAPISDAISVLLTACFVIAEIAHLKKAEQSGKKPDRAYPAENGIQPSLPVFGPEEAL